VLNNKGDVAPETYARVRQVIQDLNYTASLAAKSMRSYSTNVIGVVVPDLVDSFYLNIIRGVGDAIRTFGYDLIVYTSGAHALHTRASWQREHVALLSGGLTGGIIVVTPSAPNFPDSSSIVVIDPHDESIDVPSIISTNYEGAVDVMHYLLALGHRRIGFIKGRHDLRSAMRRFKGYSDCLADAGILQDPMLLAEGEFTRRGGREAGRYLLSLSEPPTAIFAANDESALGVMEAARELGIHIPRDLSVVGFDNIPEAAQETPSLTTVDQATQEMGTLATKMLADVLQGRSLTQTTISVPTRLVIRQSCQAIA
jgi:LacI family transcriptional regulator